MRQVLKRMLGACDKPILEYDHFGGVHGTGSNIPYSKEIKGGFIGTWRYARPCDALGTVLHRDGERKWVRSRTAGP